MKLKIDIKHWVTGSVLFEYEAEDNTIRKTLERAVGEHAYLEEADLKGADLKGADLKGAYLKGADLEGAYLEGADLEGADLKGADLKGAYLKGADLKGADLEGAYLEGADLKGADLKGAKLKHLPNWFINQASRDMLFVFEHVKDELPFLRDKLVTGKVDGTQYKGDCACLIGTLGNADGGIDKVCEIIPYYDMGLHNPGENWFFQIKKDDTPKNNEFAAHVLKLIDIVLKKK